MKSRHRRIQRKPALTAHPMVPVPRWGNLEVQAPLLAHRAQAGQAQEVGAGRAQAVVLVREAVPLLEVRAVPVPGVVVPGVAAVAALPCMARGQGQDAESVLLS